MFESLLDTLNSSYCRATVEAQPDGTTTIRATYHEKGADIFLVVIAGVKTTNAEIAQFWIDNLCCAHRDAYNDIVREGCDQLVAAPAFENIVHHIIGRYKDLLAKNQLSVMIDYPRSGGT